MDCKIHPGSEGYCSCWFKEQEEKREKEATLKQKAKELIGNRTIPRDRIEAALFGYSEEEWQELVRICEELKI